MVDVVVDIVVVVAVFVVVVFVVVDVADAQIAASNSDVGTFVDLGAGGCVELGIDELCEKIELLCCGADVEVLSILLYAFLATPLVIVEGETILLILLSTKFPKMSAFELLISEAAFLFSI